MVSRDHVRIMRRDRVIEAAGQQHLHQPHIVRIHVPFSLECDLGRFLVSALAKPHATTVPQQILDIALAAIQVRLDHRPNRGISRADPFHQFDSPLRVNRSFHIHAQKIIVARGPLDDRKNQAFAEFGAQIETKLRQLAGDIGLQAFPWRCARKSPDKRRERVAHRL